MDQELLEQEIDKCFKFLLTLDKDDERYLQYIDGLTKLNALKTPKHWWQSKEVVVACSTTALSFLLKTVADNFGGIKGKAVQMAGHIIKPIVKV